MVSLISKKLVMTLMFLLLSTVLVACSSKGDSAIVASSQSATLVFWSGGGDLESQFNDKIGDAVRKKFPNYTIKYISSHDPANKLPALEAAGTPIDIYYESIGGFDADVQQAGFQYDLTGLLKKNGVDLNRFDPTSIEAMKQMANGGIWGLPVWTDEIALYYNKDIFDKFGVSYPKNGMTWDEVLSLSKQLTKNDGGKQYIGLSVDVNHMLRLNPFSLSYVDPKTGQATINTDPKWKELYQTVFIDPAQNPNYQQTISQLGDKLPYVNEFVHDQNLAMIVVITGITEGSSHDSMLGLNWDMASLPTFTDQPGIGSQMYPVYFGITSPSKYKDAAMDVLKYLTSDEFQADQAKRGIVPVLNNKTIQKELGQNSEFKGKNFSALVFNKFAPISLKSQYDGTVEKFYSSIAPQLAEGAVDVNTAFRTAEDQANKSMETTKNQK
ncbi:MAG: hypothetical protein JWN30_1083 [Bacilli bacterium]|nr:hypothetical protein [Bacilli bacterium]